ncbi:MAG TPA: permease-like cell division protein FtsX [Candidatus Limnocylindrales bacterium]|nr:permease-like cell division protein FtsX [Candidatus Limnocylindrales bacterium]
MNHRLITLGRIIKAGAQNFMRNATLAIAAIAVMVITLTIVLFSLITNAAFGHTIQQITDKIDVSVFLKDTVTVEQRDKLLADLRRTENVKSVEYQSKEDVLRQQQKPTDENLDLQLALAQIDNPFPATVHIKPHDPNKLQSIQTYLEKPEIQALQSSKTTYSGDKKKALDNITRSTKFLREAGLVGVLIFAVVSMLIIFNTIRMAIFNRRDELQIMRLLGASTSYIRGPFVVETIIYGVVSAIISVTVINSLFVVSGSAFAASNFGLLDIGFANNYFRDRFWIILASQLLIGILIGAVSSTVATRRYLKFKSSK